jgi:heme/copper-type cytochrome/quinol oxidase subunit 3
MTHAAAVPAAERYMPGIGVPNLKLGMWVFLLSEVMFFTALIASYVILRFANPGAFAEPGVVLNVPLTAINTFILICSSVTMVKAFAAIEVGDQRGLKFWLIGTIVLGSTFLGIQVYEYIELAMHGFVPMASLYAAEGGPLYGATFYTMTGFHGLHVAIGVACLIFTTVKAFRGKYTARNHEGVEIMGLYWHFVDLVWIVLFTIVYLI